MFIITISRVFFDKYAVRFDCFEICLYLLVQLYCMRMNYYKEHKDNKIKAEFHDIHFSIFSLNCIV